MFNKRALAFMIDYSIEVFLIVVFNCFLLISPYTKFFALCIFLALPIIYFKDIVHGQSFGKKLLKIKVVDYNGNTPSIFKLILRNITIMIWPVEVLLLLLEKEKLGDRIAKTKIVLSN